MEKKIEQSQKDYVQVESYHISKKRIDGRILESRRLQCVLPEVRPRYEDCMKSRVRT
jgi:hypothetical protein